MTAPTSEQLLILADRATKGLTPAEAAVLRAGIQRLADQRENDRRTIGGLNAAIRTLKHQEQP